MPPLDVPSDTPGRVCSLEPDDYIKRTGEIDGNGNVPVEVKPSAISDCGIGLVTRVSENDLEAPSATPLLNAAGQARADVSAPRTLNQL